MPYARDTLLQLRTKARADLAAASGLDTASRRSVAGIFADVLAALHYGQFGYLDWIARQSVPFTARDEAEMAWAALINTQKKPAVAATGNVLMTGTPGAQVLAGDLLQRPDGAYYQVTTGATVGGSSAAVTVPVVAVAAGAAGDADPGTVLAVATPRQGMQPAATVDPNGLTGGADLEGDDELLQRMLAAYAAPPQGGNAADYANWALEVPGVTRAWTAESLAGAGTVTVFFMMDDARLASNGIPVGSNGVSRWETRDRTASGDQLLVADYLYGLRTLGTLVYACAPIAVPLNLSLAETTSDPTVRAAIATALADLCRRRASPGGALLADDSAGGVLYRDSDLEPALAAVPGLTRFRVVAPTADVVLATGQISVPGTITYL